jgi:hypothetical protein
MMRLVPIVASLVIAAGTAEARRPYRPAPPPVDVGAELGAAIRARSAARVGKLLADPIQNYGVWFADAACAKQFGTPGAVAGPQVQAFARCLAGLKLQATTRQPGASDSAILTYDPGIELELAHGGGRVRWIGFLAQTEDDRGRPTLTALAFEALRRAGKVNLDETVGGKLEPLLERAKRGSVSAWMKICIDEQGALDQVAMRHSDAPASLAQKAGTAFEVALRSWRFRPFEIRGKAMSACTMTLLTYPAASAPLVETLPPSVQPSYDLGDDDEVVASEDEEDGVPGGVAGGGVGTAPPKPTPPPPPAPAAPPITIPPTMLEPNRLSGDKDIEPYDATKTEIAQSGKGKLVGSYKLCVDAQGAVSTVNQLKSTGFPDYDAKIRAEMKQWTFKPYLNNGKPTPACTAFTFIYTPPPAGKKP